MRVVVQSELVANEPVPVTTKDPRAAAALAAPLVAEEHSTYDMRAVLVHITRRTRLRMAAGMDHVIDGPEGWVYAAESRDDLGADHGHRRHRAGRSRCASTSCSPTAGRACARCPSVRDQVDAALAAARKSGWDGLCQSSAHYLDEFWDHADVELEGDLELQQAVRFSIFHALQAGRPRRAARDPRQGADRARLRRPLVLGLRELRAPAAHLHGAPTPRPTRCAGAGRRSTSRWSAPRTLHLRGRRVPVAHDPRRRSARATGRRARPRSTSTPASRRR